MFAWIKKLLGKADVNQDGKVDTKDAKVVAAKVRTETKQVVANATNTVKKAKAKAKSNKSKPKA